MAKIQRPAGTTSNVLEIFIQDSRRTDGGGLTGLTNSSTGLTCYYKRNKDSGSVAVSLAAITALGTFASGGFKEVDSVHMPGVYEFDPPDAALAIGSDSVKFLLSGAANMVVSQFEIDLWDSLSNIVPGNYAGGTAGAALGRIGAGQIVTVNPVAQNGSVAIVSGMDYFAADGRSLDFTDASAQWPDLTGATINLTIYSSFGGTALFSKAGSVVAPSGAGKKVRAELSFNDTSGLLGGSGYHFIVSAVLSDGHKADLVRGSFAVVNP